MICAKRQRRGVRGFSLIELMIVVGITLIVAAVAVPQVLNGLRYLRLRSSASSIAGLIQQTRQRSVRDNRYYAMLSGTHNNAAGGIPIAFIDLNNNGQYDAREPMVMLSDRVTLNPAAPNFGDLRALVSPGGAMDLRASNGFPQVGGQVNPVTFNPRGWPCVPGAGAIGPAAGIQVCPTLAAGAPGPAGYVWFLQSAVLPNGGWAAITASPAGRIRTWACNSAAAATCNWR